MLATEIALICSAISLLLFYLTSDFGLFFNLLFLFIAGAGNGGPDVILSGTTAVDLGEKDSKTFGDPLIYKLAFPLILLDCVSAVAGFISGFGALGAVSQGPLIALTVHFFQRDAVFYVVMLFSLLPVAAVIRARRLDPKQLSRTASVHHDATKKTPSKPTPDRR